MDRLDYFIRRILLIIPTFIGITFLCFTIIQFVPGGPVEQAIMRMRGGGEGGETVSANAGEAGKVSETQREYIRKHYGFDQPFPKRYWKWLVTDRIGLKMESYKFPNKTAWQLISERFPVSLIFGLTGFIVTYLVCIPLGVINTISIAMIYDCLDYMELKNGFRELEGHVSFVKRFGG